MDNEQYKALSKDEVKEYENKLAFKYTSLALILLILLSILSLLIIFLIYLYYPAVPTKKHIKYTYTPNLIKDTTTLESDGSLILSDETDTYKVTVNFKNKTGSGGLGSYATHNHIYEVYGANPNTLNISVSLFDTSKGQVVDKVSNVTYDIYLGEDGDHLSHLDSSKYTITDNVLSYSDTNDIYIYTLTVDMDITL